MRSKEVLSNDEPLVERIAEEILRRQRDGERPTVDEYCIQYPEHAEELRAFLPALMVVEGLKPNSKDLSGTFGGPLNVEGKRREFIGDYRILRELGRGGMGVVYEAEQQSLGRHVALKVLLRTVAGDSRAAKRFESEAKAAARMHHTNIVPVFDVGSDEDHLFYAMQLIQGQAIDLVIDDLKQLRNVRGSSAAANGATKARNKSIAHSLVAGHFHQDQLLEQTQDSSAAEASVASKQIDVTETLDAQSASRESAVLPGQRDMSSAEDNRPTYFLSVAKIGHQTAEGLAYAHARGIIHRDIKPANLLLDGNGIVWITDFGLAKTGDHGMTHTGDILGTIRYMSPERFKGQCDVRADVYSLGLTLYELLTLQPAFSASDQLKLIDRIVKSEPAAPRTLDASVPRDLETIVLKCIDKDPRRRYQSADELCEDLDRFIHDEPVKARRISLPERVARWSRRNKSLAAALAVVATLLLTLNIAGTLVTWRMASLKNKAVLAEQRAIQQERATRSALYAANMNLGAQYALTPGAVAGIADVTSPWIPNVDEPDRRGWEWYYLRSRLYQDEWTLKLPENTMGSQLSPDWTRLATHDGQSIWVWDPSSGELIGCQRIRDGSIESLGWHPDGIQLTIGLENGKQQQHNVKLWNTKTGNELVELATLKSPAKNLEWSPDGTHLACVSQEQTTVLDMRTGDSFKIDATPTGRESSASLPKQSIAWSPDGQCLAVRHVDEQGLHTRLWDVKSRSLDRTLDSFGAKFAWSPDGKTLADGQLHHLVICNLDDATERMQLRGHVRAIFGVAWSPTGRWIASCADDRTIRIWDAEALEELRVLEGHQDRVNWIAWDEQGERIASASDDGTIKFWTVRENRPPPIGNPLEEPRATLAWHPSGTRLCLSDQWGQSINIWDREEKDKPLAPMQTESGRMFNLALSPDGRYLAASNGHATFKIWDLQNTGNTVILPHPDGEAPAKTFGWAEWSPDGKLLATAVRNGKVELWDVQALNAGGNAQPSHRRTLGDVSFSNPYRTLAWNNPYRTLAWNPDGTRLAAGRNQGQIKIWDFETGESMQLLGGHEQRVVSMSWSPNGQWLVSCGDEDSIIVWDVSSCSEVRRLHGHTNSVLWVDWSPDGKRIASAGTDTSVKIWDAGTGQEMMTLLGHGGFVCCAEWSSDGMILASSDVDGVTLLWDATKGYQHQEIELATSGE